MSYLLVMIHVLHFDMASDIYLATDPLLVLIKCR